MDKEMTGSGRTYEEAVADACEKMGIDPEYVDYEVLERPHTTFFGLKHIPAKVKITVKEEYIAKFYPPEKPKAAPREERLAQKPQERKPQQEQRRPKDEQSKEPRPPKKEQRPQERPAKQERPQQPRPQQPKPQPQAQQPKPQPQPEKAERPAPVREHAENREQAKEIPPEVLAIKGEAAAQYIREVLTAMGYPEAKVTVGQKEGMIVLQLEGEGLGAVVGRRGDNLDSMQYLASLVANRGEGSYCRVVLDVDDYRNKREASLQAYARKIANQAVRSGRSTTLEPMNPYERRIVHSAVQTVNGATSRSVGSEPNRRVVISAADGASRPQAVRDDKRPPRDDRPARDDRPPREGFANRDDRRGGRGGRGGKPGRDGGRERRESQKIILPPSNEPPKSDDAGVSLYGKIEL